MRCALRYPVVALMMFGVMTGCGSDSKTTANTAAAGADVTVAGAAGDVTVAAVANGTPVAVTAADTSDTAQTLTVDPVTVKAGPVTFTLKNTGNRQHEMVVLKTDEAFDQLKVGADNKVSEDASVGEISETDAGKTVSTTLTLAAGAYVLVCNIEKHYGQGMRSAFTVTP
jgi:uncharacterized cupredoxin-like copper-binding protein